MEPFVVTKEMMLKASTYIPLREKKAYAENIAESCLIKVQTASQLKVGEKLLGYPLQMGENTLLKMILLQNVMLGHYFDIDVLEVEEKLKAENPDADSIDMFDYFASAHIANQIERFKVDADVKNKSFEILSDFKDFKKIVETEIANRKMASNDAIARFTAAIQLSADPETMKKMFEQLKIETQKLPGAKKPRQASANHQKGGASK